MNFDFSKMKKEQKQVLILVAMWAIGGLFALYHFVLQPFFQDSGESAGELEKLQQQILKAQIAMDDEAEVRNEFETITGSLRERVREFVVPAENPLTWVTEKVYNGARLVGVDIQSVGEVGSKSPVWANLVKESRYFKPYTVRIVTECSYSELLALVSALEMSNPYLVVNGIIVTGQDQDPTRHMVSLVVQWPIWGREATFELADVTHEGAEE